MEKTKFTVRVDSGALDAARKFAWKHGTTVTSLVEEFFRSLGKVEEIHKDTPILQELIGSLKSSDAIEDYHAHLEEKYLGDNRKDE